MTLFTLHSDQVYFFIHPLYRFNEWWAFTVVMIHLVFMQYTFMNVVSGVIFEEHRMAVMLEGAAEWKPNSLGAWFRTGLCCLRRSHTKEPEEEGKKPEENREVESLREKMREEKEKRKRRRNDRNKNMI